MSRSSVGPYVAYVAHAYILLSFSLQVKQDLQERTKTYNQNTHTQTQAHTKQPHHLHSHAHGGVGDHMQAGWRGFSCSYFCSYSCSYCLDEFKVAVAAAVVLEGDWPLVEEPLEGHVQRGVVRGLAAQHHALAHRHLHPARAQLHAHGICKHKAAALSPQANTMDELEQCFSTGGVSRPTFSFLSWSCKVTALKNKNRTHFLSCWVNKILKFLSLILFSPVQHFLSKCIYLKSGPLFYFYFLF